MHPIKEKDARKRWCPLTLGADSRRTCETRGCGAWRFVRESALGGGAELVVEPKTIPPFVSRFQENAEIDSSEERGVCVALPAVSVSIAMQPRGLA